MDTLIVVVTHNTRALLAECLQSIEEDPLCHGIPIVVVDNASTDGSAALVTQCFPWCHLLRNERNLGYAAGANSGIATRKSDLVLLMNADVRVLPGSVQALRDFMEEQPDVDVAGPRVLSPEGQLQLTSRTFYDLPTILFRRTPLGLVWPDHGVLRRHLMKDWGHDEVRDVDWLVGGCLAIRTSALRETGGLDDRFFLYFEDTDLCRTARERGRRVSYVPTATFIHHYQQGSRTWRGGHELRAHHLGSGLKYFAKWKMGMDRWAVRRREAAD